MTSVLMHELGHNFNLAHSGGLDGGDYSDHTGYVYLSFAVVLRPAYTCTRELILFHLLCSVMGNPLFSENFGKL